MVLTPLQDNLIKSLEAVQRDFTANAPSPKTSSEKVQDLFTSVMDVVGLVQTTSTLIFAVSAHLYVRSYFSTAASIISPFTFITALATGIIAYDSHQTYQSMKGLNDWVRKNYPNHNDVFVLNDQVYNRWSTFKTELKYNTVLAETLARPYIQQTTKVFGELKQNFVAEHFSSGMMIAGNGSNKKQKAYQFTVLVGTGLLRIVNVPLKFIGDLYTRLNSTVLG